jgi:uncharacterized protein involved in exopolysaccharide biosynthesis
MLDTLRPAPMQESGKNYEAHAYITYGDVLRFCTNYWRTLAIGAMMGFLAAVAYIATATPIFTASTQVLIENDLQHTFREQVSESFASLDTPQVESQLAIMRSESIAEKVVERLELLDKAEPKVPPSLAQRFVSSIFRSEPMEPDPDKRAGALAGIRNGLDARREGLSYAINISFQAADPTAAAKVANAIADAYVDDQLDTRARAAAQGSKWLEGRIDELRKQMNTAALDVQQFKAKRDYRIVSRPDSAAPQARTSRTDLGEPPSAGEQYTLEELESRALTYRKIFESFLQAYAESVQRQSYPVTNARVITRATPPKRRSYPRRMLSLASGLIAGTLAGLGVAFVMSSFGWRNDFNVTRLAAWRFQARPAGERLGWPSVPSPSPRQRPEGVPGATTAQP